MARSSGALNIQGHAARLHQQVPASTLRAGHGPCVCCFFWGGGGGWAEPPVLAGLHRQYLNTAEASKIQTQSAMQDAMVGETLHGISNMFCLRERFSA